MRTALYMGKKNIKMTKPPTPKCSDGDVFLKGISKKRFQKVKTVFRDALYSVLHKIGRVSFAVKIFLVAGKLNFSVAYPF